MKLQNRKIVFVVAIQCEYGGTIIALLKKLGMLLVNNYQANVYWILPSQPKISWIEDLQKDFTVEFTHKPYKKTESELFNLFNRIKPDIVHSHFEAYDICIAKAIKRIGLPIKQIWHIHDYMSYKTKGENLRLFRYVRRRIAYPLHYAYYGRNAYFIAVSSEMAAFCGYYRKHLFTKPPYYSNDELSFLQFDKTTTVINGIDETRIDAIDEKLRNSDNVFRFLSFGGAFRGKGIDMILSAGELLYTKNQNFEIILTRGKNLENSIDNFYRSSKRPEWLRVIPQNERISELFTVSDCYISASRGETMSLAIAEATFFKKPVIQNDIPGTWWNAKRPSTFIFKAEDVSELAQRMQEVIQYPTVDLLVKCEETYKNNKELLSLEKWCNSIIKIYETV